MMVLRALLTTAVLACLSTGTPAQAITVSFTGSDQPFAGSTTFTRGGLNIGVTAGTFGTGSNPSTINFGSRFVDVDIDGIGAAFPLFDANDNVDGNFGNDVLVFTFNRNVILERILFGNVDRNDDFAFGSVSGNTFTRYFDDANVRTDRGLRRLATPEERTGLSFGIGAIDGNDNFTVTGLQFSFAPVPLPAAGFMLLGALAVAGGAAARRRRKAA